MTTEIQARPNPPSLIVIALMFAIVVVGALMFATVYAIVTHHDDTFKRIEQKLDAPAQTGVGR